MSDVHVSEATPDDAPEVLRAIRAAFGAREPLDPPSTALEETEGTVAAALAEHGGLLARLDGAVVGALLFSERDGSLSLRRVSVVPEAQRRGVAHALARAAEEVAAGRGDRRIELTARVELPGTIKFWHQAGYRETRRTGTMLVLTKELPVTCAVPTGEAMQELGKRLSGVVRAGDLLILSGDLGAGKTTFTQGLGAGLGVRGQITSPTFVISRVHPSLGDGPALVHVDAYRLGGLAELDDLDLDVSVEESVTVVEWGTGLAEDLAEDRLEITFSRPVGGSGEGEDEPRQVTLAPVGARWVGADLGDVVA